MERANVFLNGAGPAKHIRPVADSCDVDQHSWLKPITIPAIPIKVGAQRRWRD